MRAPFQKHRHVSIAFSAALALANLLMPLAFFVPTAHAATTFGARLAMPSNTLGLTAHWTFDGGDLITNVKDASGQGNNGFLVGFTSTSSAVSLGMLGQALSFNGSTQYISTSYTVPALSSGTSFTWSAWMKLNSGNSNTVVILGFRNGATWVKLTPTAFEYGSGSLMSHSIPTGSWVHIVIVKSGSNFTYYQNGASIATASNSGSVVSHTFFIGADPDFSSDGKFSGTVDDVRVYGRALSAAEVTQMYQQGNGTGGSQLKGCGFGTFLPGSNKCRGFITNGTQWTAPKDWTASGATIEAIGPGGSGATAIAGSSSGGGGQGGGYGKVTSPSHINAGDTLAVQIGAGGSTNPTFLKDNTNTIIVQGDYGASGSNNTGGNRTQTNTGDTTYSGGAGGDGGSGGANRGGGGGGGSAGPIGAGKAGGAGQNTNPGRGAGGGGSNGGSSSSGGNGTGTVTGSGGNGTSGAGGGPGATGTANATVGTLGGGGGGGQSGVNAHQSGAAGGMDTTFDAAHGSGGGGGGGGGGGSSGVNNGGNGSTYGGGGGGSAECSSLGTVGSPGLGGQGLIAVTYTPSWVTAGSIAKPISATINTTPTPPNLATGLVGHWTFDGANLVSNVRDSSVTGNNGRFTGITSTSSAVTLGILGQALKFSANNQGVTVTYNSAYNWGSTESVSAWIYLTQTQQQWARVYKQSASSGSGLNLELDSSNKPKIQINGTTITSSNALQLNRWYLYTETYDGVTAKIYINDVLDKSQALTGTIADYNEPLIFAKGAGGTEQFYGIIDDIRAYNRVLSANEIKQLYALGH